MPLTPGLVQCLACGRKQRNICEVRTNMCETPALCQALCSALGLKYKRNTHHTLWNSLSHGPERHVNQQLSLYNNDTRMCPRTMAEVVMKCLGVSWKILYRRRHMTLVLDHEGTVLVKGLNNSHRGRRSRFFGR